MIRVVLADDQLLFVENLKYVLEQLSGDIQIVGVAHSGKQAVEMILQHSPDIALLDVRMPAIDGVAVVERVHPVRPSTRIIMLTTFDDDEYIHEALAHGAIGYLLKDMPPADLIQAIHVVMSGQVIVSPGVVQKLLRDPHQLPAVESSIPPWMLTLTKRERELLKFIARGLDNRQISEEMCVTPQTIRNHMSEIYSKLGVGTRLEAIRLLSNLDIDSIPL
ncbi:response regulator transcription factor [Marispirochaeta aestuarii]|uniref:response regulator transcription factor n=1 Tax=Marispirochaeta aestuarii TaxID=1963862 RepID=UPI0029C99D5F|nr:response regulator transcription factor [Marispirochaeta aestuarii]